MVQSLLDTWLLTENGSAIHGAITSARWSGEVIPSRVTQPYPKLSASTSRTTEGAAVSGTLVLWGTPAGRKRGHSQCISCRRGAHCETHSPPRFPRLVSIQGPCHFRIARGAYPHRVYPSATLEQACNLGCQGRARGREQQGHRNSVCSWQRAL